MPKWKQQQQKHAKKTSHYLRVRKRPFHAPIDIMGDQGKFTKKLISQTEMKHTYGDGNIHIWRWNMHRDQAGIVTYQRSVLFFFLLFYYLATILLASVVSLVSAVSFRWFRYGGLFSSFRVLVHAIWTISGYLTVNFKRTKLWQWGA